MNVSGTRPPSIWLRNGSLALGCLLVSCSKPSAPSPVVPTAPAKAVVENQGDPELKLAGEHLILVLESGQSDDFLDLASKEGVCFGMDCETVRLEKMRKEFQDKKGVYCELFDTPCLRKEMLAQWRKTKHKGDIRDILSFRDIFKDTPERTLEMLAHDSIMVHFRPLDSEKSSKRYVLDQLEFSFVKEDGRWKLTDVLYD